MISGAKRIIANGAGHCYVDFVDIDHFDRPATELKDFADGFVYYMLQNGGN
jgi:hypothetical protein